MCVCPRSTQVSKRSSCNNVSRDDAGRDDSYSSLDADVLKIVTCLVWGKYFESNYLRGRSLLLSSFIMRSWYYL